MMESLARLSAALSDRYTIDRELGAGGMATVYLAKDLKHDRRVALKVLRPEIAVALGTERFLQEIQIAAKLNHPHILALHDSGEADGFLYYVMPHVEGESLREKLNREKQLGIDDALRVTEQIANALGYAHGQGIIHRDIKPENILLHEGVAMVADFGIALAVSAAGGERLTETGLSVGTPEYMSPEQGTGEPHIDGRSDVYSLACVLYEMLAGEPPFTGPTAQAVIAKRAADPPPAVRRVRQSVTEPVDKALQKALAQVPADRFATPRQFVEALTATDHLTRTGRKRLAATAAGIGALAIAGVVGIFLLSPTVLELDGDFLAVAPFDILTPDPELQFWDEGFVDMLSRSLDGAGALRTVSPTVVIRRWQGRADPASAADLGRATGARLALYGSLLGAGADSVRLAATVMDVESGVVLAEFAFRDEVERVDRLVDSLTLGVILQLGRTRRRGQGRLSGMGTASLPAIKAFLKGEQFLRASDWDSAQAYYERAIAADTTFALGLFRLSGVLTWQDWFRGTFLGDRATRVSSVAAVSAYAWRADAHNRGLAPRESLLIAAESLYAAVVALQWSDAGWASRARRLRAILEGAARRYPDDPDIWERLGDVRLHVGYLDGVPDHQALAAFERSIALDPAFAPTYLDHAIELALRIRGPDHARKLARDYLTLDPTGPGVAAVELFIALVDSTARPNAVEAALDAAAIDQLYWNLQSTSEWLDSAEIGVRIARAIAKRPRDARGGVSTFALAIRGHVREAARIGGRMSHTGALLGVIPPERAANVFRPVLDVPGGVTLQGLPWWAAIGDTVSIRRLLENMDTAVPNGAPENPWPVYTRAVAEAYYELARGDSTEALRRFIVALRYPPNAEIPQRSSLPESVCPVHICIAERLEIGRLLVASNRDHDAVAVLDWSYSQADARHRPIFAIERGRVHERLGNRDQAIESYSYVLDAWRAPDPELMAIVEEARAALVRLASEPQRR